jgi:hypothetical protein
MVVAKAAPRDERGRLLPREDSLGKSYGLRVRKDFDPLIAELAEADGITPSEWCRKQVEAAIIKAQPRKNK